MKELQMLANVSPSGRVFREMLSELTPPGSPVYNIPNPEVLGYPGRKDTDDTLTPSQMNEGIFQEGVRMAGYEAIDIGNDRELVVFNTSAASAHTLFTVNYQEWATSLRKQGKALSIEIPDSTLIEGKDSTSENPMVPSLIPLDMVTWVMVRDYRNNSFMPCDVNDLTSPAVGDQEIDKHKLQLSEETLHQLFSAVSKRNRLAIATILDLHNTVLREEMPFIRTKEESDLLIGCLSGYYRGDDAKQLKQFEHDHLGKGPMSNPTLHFRITDHFSMEDANILDQRNPRMSFRNMITTLQERFPSYFGGSIDFAAIKPESLSSDTEHEVLQRFLTDPRFSLYDLIKSIDPYASLAHEYLADWLENELEVMFADIEHVAQQFAHHTSDYERELRVSEGLSLKLSIPANDHQQQDALVAECYTRMSQWIGRTLYPMWQDIQNFVKQKAVLSKVERETSLNHIIQRYNLPLDVAKAIGHLHPTEKQLKLFRSEIEHSFYHDKDTRLVKLDKHLRKYHKRKLRNIQLIQEGTELIQKGEGTFDDLIGLLTLIQSSQIYDNDDVPEGSPKLNDGYNIPGVPGTAITYAFDQEGYLTLNIGWLLSTKGLAELWLGSIMKRQERRDR